MVRKSHAIEEWTVVRDEMRAQTLFANGNRISDEVMAVTVDEEMK